MRTLAIALSGVLLTVGAAGLRSQPAAAQQPRPNRPGATAKADDVQVTSWVSKTAMWVGDPLDYVVELVLAPNIEVLSEDLAAEKLRLDGLVVVSAENERLPRENDAVTHRFRFRLTTYAIGQGNVRIGASTVRYYIRRAGERPEDARPAGEVRVPGAVIARRSTLPDEIATLAIRDRGAAVESSGAFRVAGPVGLGLMLAAVGPLVVWGGMVIRGSRHRVRRPSARVARSHARAALEELRTLDVSSAASRLEAYGRLDAALRHHLTEAHGIPAPALAARELTARLKNSDGSPRSADGIIELVAECERARYDSPERLPPPDQFAAALSAAERIVEGPR